jgi:hypothetical protein
LSGAWRRSALSADNKVSSLSSPVAGQVVVSPVQSKGDRDDFIKLPWRLYSQNRYWVPPLLRIQHELLSPKTNPFFQHADVQLFIARRNGEPVGRISAQVDHEHNRYHNERTGFFGFFESVEDPEVAGLLTSAAESWLRERRMDRVRGPMNFSSNGEIGFLLSGFDMPPMVLMPYTHEYYLRLMEGCGFSKAKDLYAYRWDRQPVAEGPPARMVRELRKRPEVKIRRANMRDFREEVRTILRLYNDSFAQNWGFVPATEAEADQMASDLKPLVDPAIVPFVEIDGKPAGVALAIPNLNEAIYDLNGRLFPFGFIKLLWRLKVRRVRTGRLVILGIAKEFRTREYAGLAYLLCDEIYHRGIERGYDWAEFSWTLEDNHLINNLIEKVDAVRYKTYRLYEKELMP